MACSCRRGGGLGRSHAAVAAAGGFGIPSVCEARLPGAADLAALPAELEGAVAIELGGLELDVVALVVGLAPAAQVVVGKVGGMPADSDDGRGEASVAGMAAMDKVGAGSSIGFGLGLGLSLGSCCCWRFDAWLRREFRLPAELMRSIAG